MKQCTVHEMKEYAQKEHMDIKIADRIKLQRAVEMLADKTRIINPEEIQILKSIDEKVQRFERTVSDLNSKQTAIDQQRKSMEMAINLGFDALIKKLESRKEIIMKQLDQIMNQRSNVIDSSINICSTAMGNVNKLREESQDLVDTAINIKELDDRTNKLTANKRKITKIITETNLKNEKNQYTGKINFVLDTKKAAIV